MTTSRLTRTALALAASALTLSAFTELSGQIRKVRFPLPQALMQFLGEILTAHLKDGIHHLIEIELAFQKAEFGFFAIAALQPTLQASAFCGEITQILKTEPFAF